MTNAEVKKVFDALEGGTAVVASLLPADWKPWAQGISAALGLVGDLIAAGEGEPAVAITELRSAVPEVNRVRDSLEDRLAARFNRPRRPR